MPESSALANPDPENVRLVVGCGYVGVRVAARWQAQGRRVLAITRHRSRELSEAGIVPILADITKQATLNILPAYAAVVYCVGFDRNASPSMRDVYVRGLSNVLAVLPRGGRFIYVSSTSVYGDADGDWVDETSPTDPIDESGRIVLEAEELLRRERPGAIILRFAGIYGPGRSLRRVEALRAGEPIAADPDKWLNLIHADDGAAAVLATEQRGQAGEAYNVCDGVPVRRGEFFTRLAGLLGASPPSFTQHPSGRDRGNRRVANRRMRDELRVALEYPSYVEGLAASMPSSPE